MKHENNVELSLSLENNLSFSKKKWQNTVLQFVFLSWLYVESKIYQ